MRPRLLLFIALTNFPAFAAASAADKQAPTQFIDKSVVTYPTALGKASLTKGDYDPANFAAGVSLDYHFADGPRDLRFDIYVYPRGRADTAKTVDEAVGEVEGEIREMEKQGRYAGITFNEAVPFDVAEPASSMFKNDEKTDKVKIVDVAPANASTQTSSTAEDADTDALFDALKNAPPDRTIGRKRALTMSVRGTPYQSLAFVFYRNLFLISVRASEPVDAQPSTEFNAFVDRAVQALVPTIDIANFGDCGTMLVSVGEKTVDGKKDAQRGALDIVSEMGRVMREGCANAPDPTATTPAGHERQTIVYPPGTWK